MTGQVGGKPFSLHAEGERVILMREEGERQEVDLNPSTEPAAVPEPVCPARVLDGDFPEEPEPGVSALDGLFGIDANEGGDHDEDGQ